MISQVQNKKFIPAVLISWDSLLMSQDYEEQEHVLDEN